MISFTRSAVDSREETLTLVQLTSADKFHCGALDRETPFLVEVSAGDERVCLCDLDGDVITDTNWLEWEPATDAPADVIAQVQEGWATGNFYVTRNA